MEESPEVEQQPLLGSIQKGRPNQGQKARSLIVAAIGTVSAFSLTLIGLFVVGEGFSKACSAPCPKARDYEGCLSVGEYVGVFLVYVFSVVFFYMLGHLKVEVGQCSLSAGSRILVYIFMAIVEFILLILAFRYLIQIKTVYFVVEDVLLVFIGGFWVVALIPMMITALYLAWRTLPARRSVEPHSKLTAPLFDIKGFLVFFIMLMLWALADSSFSSVWNYSTRSYSNATSPYNLLSVSSSQYVIRPMSLENTTVLVEPIYFNFKLYLDVLLYFLWLFVVGSVGFLLGPALTTRLNIKIPYAFEQGMSVGELFLMGAIGVLYTLWIWYFGFYYDRIRNETKIETPMPGVCCNNATAQGQCTDLMEDEYPEMQIAARVLGHLTTLTMSLAIVPAARNSLLVSCFSIPFERAIKYHRFLGFMAWLLVTLHMLVWQIKWLQEGTLLHNVFTVDELKISRAQFHEDNFTILIVHFAWLITTVMVILALWFRRKNYELFYYAHQAASLFIVAAVIHAWAFWYYAAGGFFIWYCDRLIRVIHAAQQLGPVVVWPEGDVTCVRLPRDTFARLSGASHFAGQYAWLNFAGLEPHWHPFTISSGPQEDEVTFHIKAMGPGTFTQRLNSMASTPEAQILRVDGPYGRPQAFDQARTLVLVAGGIGVTPMHSILSQLVARKLQNCGHIMAVHFFWNVRSKALLNLESISKTLQAAEAIGAPKFFVHVHVTRPCELQVNCGNLKLTEGRCNLTEACSDLPKGEDTMIMVCGPGALVNVASEVAFANKFSFHSEEFYF